ncbi:MAG: hypothetical protein GX556_16555 [Fibrobacter sp.]|nr:hypothetical protein [Fibrobacter sp.]
MDKTEKDLLPAGREVPLPSGKTAHFINGKGQHLMNAMKIAGDNQNLLPFALIAELATIDGQAIVAEEISEMDLPDVVQLMKEVSPLLGAVPSK